MDEMQLIAGGALSIVSGVGGAIARGWIDRLKNRDTLQAKKQEQETVTAQELVRQLFEERKIQGLEIDQLRREVDECQDHHRDCQSQMARQGLQLEKALGRIEWLENRVKPPPPNARRRKKPETSETSETPRSPEPDSP